MPCFAPPPVTLLHCSPALINMLLHGRGFLRVLELRALTCPELLPTLLLLARVLINTNKAMPACTHKLHTFCLPIPRLSTSPVHSSLAAAIGVPRSLVACSLPPMTLSGGATAAIGESATEGRRVPFGVAFEGLRSTSMGGCFMERVRLSGCGSLSDSC